MNIYTVNINDPKQYKYLRYLSGINGSCNMAEIEFYIEDSILSLSGKVIGTDGSFQNDPTRTKFAVFDGDPLTFYDAIEPNGAWAGIELDKPQRIDKLVYQFRNDDNGIRKGDLYELMYWNNDNKWKSCGKIIAKENELIYNDIPPGTLYWLRNHTRGKEERIFTYNTNQVWW